MPSVEGNVSGNKKVDVSGVSDDLNYKHEGSVVNRDANVLVEARIMDASDKKNNSFYSPLNRDDNSRL